MPLAICLSIQSPLSSLPQQNGLPGDEEGGNGGGDSERSRSWRRMLPVMDTLDVCGGLEREGGARGRAKECIHDYSARLDLDVPCAPRFGHFKARRHVSQQPLRMIHNRYSQAQFEQARGAPGGKPCPSSLAPSSSSSSPSCLAQGRPWRSQPHVPPQPSVLLIECLHSLLQTSSLAISLSLLLLMLLHRPTWTPP